MLLSDVVAALLRDPDTTEVDYADVQADGALDETEVRAAALALWPETCDYEAPKGVSVSDCLWHYRCEQHCLLRGPPDMSVRVDFDGLKPFWMHRDEMEDGTVGVPVANMCLTRLVHTVEGLHYFALAEAGFRADVGRLWRYVDACRRRAHVLGGCSLPRALLNHDVYVEADVSAGKFDYAGRVLESAQERRSVQQRIKRQKLEAETRLAPPAPAGGDAALARTNETFAFEMNAYFTEFDMARRRYAERGDVRMDEPPPAVHRLRQHLFDRVFRLRPPAVLKCYYDHVYGLRVTDAMARVYRRRVPSHKALVARVVLQSKASSLCDDAPANVEELFERTNENMGTRSGASDAFLVYASRQESYGGRADVVADMLDAGLVRFEHLLGAWYVRLRDGTVTSMPTLTHAVARACKDRAPGDATTWIDEFL